MQSWASFLVPFYYAQEAFRGGALYLFVSRYGVKRWEVYYFGASVGGDEFEKLMRPLPFGSAEWYSRLQNLCDLAGACRRIGSYETWDLAHGAVGRYFGPSAIEQRNRSHQSPQHASAAKR